MTLPAVIEELSYAGPNKIRIASGEEHELPRGYIVEMVEGGLRVKYSEVRDLGVYNKSETMLNAILDDINTRLRVLTKK